MLISGTPDFVVQSHALYAKNVRHQVWLIRTATNCKKTAPQNLHYMKKLEPYIKRLEKPLNISLYYHNDENVNSIVYLLNHGHLWFFNNT